ncbi:MAG: phage minor head protein [Nitrospiraceae bacterium]
MALPAIDPESRLLALIASAEPRLQNALLNAVTATKKSLTLDTLMRLIESGKFEEAVEIAVRAGSIRLADETAAVYTQAGQEGSKFLTDVLEVTVGFDQVNDRAVRIIQQDRLRLIREFSAEQRRATRAALTDGIRRGLNPIDQARNFRGSIGLTARQQLAVERYRTLLQEGSTEALERTLRDRRFDSTVRSAVRRGVPLTNKQVKQMTGRYSERLLAHRAKVIGRTEALRAVHAGNDEAYRQAIDDGVLNVDQLRRTWITARDERVRGSHRGLNGLTRGMDETFPGLGGPLRFPGDPAAPASETVQCRCALTTRIGTP